MKNQEKDIDTVEVAAIIEEKHRVWRIPQLTVISVTETKSGIPSFGPGEGTFYAIS